MRTASLSRKFQHMLDSKESSRGPMRLIALTLAATTLSGCANVSSLNSISGSGVTLLSLKTERSGQSDSQELRNLQERTVANSKSVVFASTINTLTDLGFRVTAADANTGFITATGGGQERILVGLGGLSRDSEVPVVSTFVEERSQGISVIRIVFAKSNLSSSARGQSGERVVSSADTYHEFFSRLDREIQSRSDSKTSAESSQNGDDVSLSRTDLSHLPVNSVLEAPEPSIASVELDYPE